MLLPTSHIPVFLGLSHSCTEHIGILPTDASVLDLQPLQASGASAPFNLISDLHGSQQGATAQERASSPAAIARAQSHIPGTTPFVSRKGPGTGIALPN